MKYFETLPEISAGMGSNTVPVFNMNKSFAQNVYKCDMNLFW